VPKLAARKRAGGEIALADAVRASYDREVRQRSRGQLTGGGRQRALKDGFAVYNLGRRDCTIGEKPEELSLVVGKIHDST